MLCLQGFHCFIIGLLRHCSVLVFDCFFLCFLRHYTISSRFPLVHSVNLRHCSVLGFDCLFLCFLRHYTISSRFPWFIICLLLCSRLRLSLPLLLTSPYYLFKVSIVSLSVCYATALF